MAAAISGRGRRDLRLLAAGAAVSTTGDMFASVALLLPGAPALAASAYLDAAQQRMEFIRHLPARPDLPQRSNRSRSCRWMTTARRILRRWW